MQIDHELHASVIAAYEGDAEGLAAFYGAFLRESEADLREIAQALLDEGSAIGSANPSITDKGVSIEEHVSHVLGDGVCPVNWRVVEKSSHRLKGRASQLGLASLAAAACRIVVLSRANHTANRVQQVPVILKVTAKPQLGPISSSSNEEKCEAMEVNGKCAGDCRKTLEALYAATARELQWAQMFFKANAAQWHKPPSHFF